MADALQLKPTRTFSAFYTTEHSEVFCTITVSQRQASDARVNVHSPGAVLPPAIYQMDSLSTVHTIQVVDINNGSLVDYANAVALCMASNGIPGEIIVGARHASSTLLYAPEQEAVKLLVLDGDGAADTMAVLREKCMERCNAIRKKG